MQISSDPLRLLLVDYQAVTKDLNISIDELVTKKNELAIATAAVEKNKNKKQLIEEQIRCEKKLIEVAT